MKEKELIQTLGFTPKENTSGIFHKEYGGYVVEADFEKRQFDFGTKITAGRETTQNFSQQENWVVLECVDRLLEKGYQPENIILEKKYKVGHGAGGGWLDILVTREDGSAYLMIECKTWGKEFDKELKKTDENGGQLITYFQQDKSADILMLYASKLDKNGIQFRNEIIKIEDHYRQAGNAEDVFDRWNKVTNTNGIFDRWVKPYLFESKKLTKKDLKPLNEEDSKKIFHEFLSILRKHSVSDKPNAFNKIFNLFLAKIFDEKKRDNKELDFQWKEHKDNAVDFQIRLLDLYTGGMKDFLEKEIRGISDDLFKYETDIELHEKKKHVLLLDKNFDIKEVFDEETFEDNHKVLKEVVQLLQKYQIRYPRKQQHLSDFFERLLTTGLKQEAGQFFTPPPITRFIIRSLPISQYIKQQLNQSIPELPAVIDYSVGSGHFLTEIMEEYQRIIEQDIETSALETDDAETNVNAWRVNKYDWASKYIYGIEKDYRLVKVAKVGCYFYGDGLAQVIHGDGLDSFEQSKSYRGLLKKNAEKPQFSFIVSNPPYSVSSFKGDLKNSYANEDFELFNSLTDRSSEIECLFIERTKQLLKTDGIAAIILPSSILSNSGIYAQAREIILKAFDIVAITEFGSATFMATGTNTVTLFLKRREDRIAEQVDKSLTTFFTNHNDMTINGIEKPISKYLSHVWEGVSFNDYQTLLQKKPNDAIRQHDIFKEYDKKIKTQKEADKWAKILEIEKEKLLYFILSFNQTVVLVKTGQKTKEKQFLGYEFSNRRGSEGMHPIQRSKTVDECTQLYDINDFENENKASTYIYKAFTENNFDLEIPEMLKENISYQNLTDMLTFDRVDFEKTISLSVLKKAKIESKWELKKFSDIIQIEYGKRIVKQKEQGSIFPVYGGGGETFKSDEFNREDRFIISRFGMSSKCMRYIKGKFFLNDSGFTVKPKDDSLIDSYLQYFLFQNQLMIYYCGRGVAQKNIDFEQFNALKIPLPPKDIQQKIVSEIEVLEKQEEKAVDSIEKLRSEISETISNSKGKLTKLEDITTKIGSGATPTGGKGSYQSSGISLIRSQNIYDHGFVEKGLAFINEEQAKKLNNVTVEQNDILFNITGASIARCCVVEDKYLPARVNQHVSIIRTNDKALPKYVQLTLVSSSIKTKLLEIGDGATSRQAITKLQLEEFKIPLPPLSEQQKIVSEIEKIEQKITDLEKQIAEIPKQKEVILKKYLE